MGRVLIAVGETAEHIEITVPEPSPNIDELAIALSMIDSNPWSTSRPANLIGQQLPKFAVHQKARTAFTVFLTAFLGVLFR